MSFWRHFAKITPYFCCCALMKHCLLCLLVAMVTQAYAQDLNTLLAQAVNTHPQVGAAVSEAQAASEGVRAAKMALLPTPTISTQLGSHNQIAQIGIRQNLWTGGRLSANIDQARYDEQAAHIHVFEAQNLVAKSTLDIWQSYLYAKGLQALYIQNLDKLAVFEAMMTRRVEAGVSARIELDLVTNRILQDQNAYQGAQEQERIALVRLAQATGNANLTPDADITAHLTRAKAARRTLEPLALDNGGEGHPSVQKTQASVLAAQASVRAQRASRYPDIYAQYQYQIQKKGGGNGDLGLGLSYDPGAGLSSFALSDAASHRVTALRQSQEVARRTVAENIATLYQQFVSARDQELSLTAAVAGANLVLGSYERQFIAGRKSWLEVLNAAREESQYKQQLLQTQTQMIGAYYKLMVDLGQMPWQAHHKAPEVSPFTPADIFAADRLALMGMLRAQNQTPPAHIALAPTDIHKTPTALPNTSYKEEVNADATLETVADGDAIFTPNLDAPASTQ